MLQCLSHSCNFTTPYYYHLAMPNDELSFSPLPDPFHAPSCGYSCLLSILLSVASSVSSMFHSSNFPLFALLAGFSAFSPTYIKKKEKKVPVCFQAAPIRIAWPKYGFSPNIRQEAISTRAISNSPAHPHPHIDSLTCLISHNHTLLFSLALLWLRVLVTGPWHLPLRPINLYSDSIPRSIPSSYTLPTLPSILGRRITTRRWIAMALTILGLGSS